MFQVAGRNGSRPFSAEHAYAPLPTSSPTSDSPSRPPSGDIIQFSAAIFYIDEDEGSFEVDVIRLGNMQGQARVTLFTRDGSAVAGEVYQALRCDLIFNDGEYTKAVMVKLLPKNVWGTTKEFRIELASPEGCQLAPYLYMCRVKVIDRDFFPSDRFSEAVQAGNVDHVHGFLLFWELWKLLFNCARGVGWRTVVTLTFDEIQNAYFVLTVYLKLYLVNVVFNTQDPDTVAQLLRPTRIETVYIVSALYVVPLALMHTWDVVKNRLDVPGRSTYFLRENLFRRFLNYTEASRLSVSAEKMTYALEHTADGLGVAYATTLRIIRDLCRLAVVICFTSFQTPHAVWFIVALPTIFLIWGFIREGCIVIERGFAQKTELGAFVRQCTEHYELIADYFQRPQMNDQFCWRAEEVRTHMIPVRDFAINSDYFFPWVRSIVLAAYIAWIAPQVLDSDVSLGEFIATMVVIKDLSEDLLNIYSDIREVMLTFKGLRRMTEYLNKTLDVTRWKEINRSRRVITTRLRQEFVKNRQDATLTPRSAAKLPKFVTDQLPIIFADVSWGHNCGSLLQDVNLTINQGSIVAILGPPCSGKSSLSSLVAHRNFPEAGMVFVPSHLRILHMCVEPHILDMSCWHNLTFGSADRNLEDVQRVKAVLKKVHLTKFVTVIEEELKRGKDELDRDSSTSWAKELTLTEKNLICLARAFIMNPEVMVMQRPLSQYNEIWGQRVLDLMAEHIRSRGLCLPASTLIDRRPRTLFYVAEDEYQLRIATHLWELQKRMDVTHLHHLLGGPFDVVPRKMEEESNKGVENLLSEVVDEEVDEVALIRDGHCIGIGSKDPEAQFAATD